MYGQLHATTSPVNILHITCLSYCIQRLGGHTLHTTPSCDRAPLSMPGGWKVNWQAVKVHAWSGTSYCTQWSRVCSWGQSDCMIEGARCLCWTSACTVSTYLWQTATHSCLHWLAYPSKHKVTLLVSAGSVWITNHTRLTPLPVVLWLDAAASWDSCSVGCQYVYETACPIQYISHVLSYHTKSFTLMITPDICDFTTFLWKRVHPLLNACMDNYMLLHHQSTYSTSHVWHTVCSG